MAPPLHQPPPSWPATLYQQAVQLPSKSTRVGVTFDSSADKAAPTGGQGTKGHGRQSTQGQDNNSRPASRSRGVQEKSSIRNTSKQMPHQVDDLPSMAPPNIPPASAPESTQPQHGGGTRASPRDPQKRAAKYRSAGWKKDLEHALKVYYRHNVASFKGAEWAKMKEKFFTHLLPCKEEMLGIKESHPMEYMPYAEDQFCRAMGLRLNGLRDFTRWIKAGSYYHGLVARQGHLHRCLHLVGMLLPRWPQVMPSESCLVFQKKAETPATSSSVPSAGAMETQGARSDDTPAPMEMAEWVMASHGPTKSRPVSTRSSRKTGLQNIAGHNRGGGRKDQHFPFPSRITRGDIHPPNSSTSMQESNRGPATMWPSKE